MMFRENEYEVVTFKWLPSPDDLCISEIEPGSSNACLILISDVFGAVQVILGSSELLSKKFLPSFLPKTMFCSSRASMHSISPARGDVSRLHSGVLAGR